MDERLEKIFENINTWLHFAEAKNAANIALVVAALAAFLGVEEHNILIYLICVVFCCSGVISLISFWPRLGSTDSQKGTAGKSVGNLLFFEDIKKLSGREYAEQVDIVYFQNSNHKISRYQLDLADEIVYNAGIVSQKYAYFKMALRLDFIAFIFVIAFLIIA